MLTKGEKYLLTCLSKIELRDAFAVPNLGGFLLCGPHGSGKTVVARSLIRKLAQNRETLACKLRMWMYIEYTLEIHFHMQDSDPSY